MIVVDSQSYLLLAFYDRRNGQVAEYLRRQRA